MKNRPIFNKRTEATYDLEVHLKGIYNELTTILKLAIHTLHQFINKVKEFKPSKDYYIVNFDA